MRKTNNKLRTIAKTTISTVLASSLILCAIIGFYYVKLPDKFYLSHDGSISNFEIDTFFNISADAQKDSTEALAVYNDDGSDNEVDLQLFGMFSIKRAELERIERPLLIPGGMPFGIKILTDGAIVTELGNVEGESGFVTPARDAGVRPGDVVVEVNGFRVQSNNDVADALQAEPNKAELLLIRDNAQLVIEVTPVRSVHDERFKIGMWVRDSGAGIGTMTFIDPANNTFAGLGHAVCDIDTGLIMPLASGEAVRVYISDVVKGYSGAPGELCGTFLSHLTLGQIKRNTASGVFGISDSSAMENSDNADIELIPVEMAFKQEIQLGAAKLLTTVEGNSPREYEVIIEKIDFNDNNQIKNMVIKVTDNELLSNSGGIVQGMSGSPLFQNGRLIGAVTHVFVNDPSRGYAIFAENMYRETLEIAAQADNENSPLNCEGGVR